jgi:hypothetical protein
MKVGQKYFRFIDGKQVPFHHGAKGAIMIGKFIGLDEYDWFIFEIGRKKVCWLMPNDNEFREAQK